MIILKSEVAARIAVPFLGGFLGAIGVALLGYLLGVAGISRLVGVAPWAITQQGLQNISWGGAMWGLIPAAFLLARKGNIYLVSFFTFVIAVTYGQFVLGKAPLQFSNRIIYGYCVNFIFYHTLFGH